MHVRRNDSRRLPDKCVIPRELLNDEELDRIVAKTTARLLNTNMTDNTETVDSETTSSSTNSNSGGSSKQRQHSHSLAQPKRPMNAFMVWGQCIRRELHNRYTNVQNAMLSKALGRVWKRLNLEEKRPYVERANTIKANHKRDYPNYRYQPRRIQERRARQLKEAARAQRDSQISNSEFVAHLDTQYRAANYVAPYVGPQQNNCVGQPNTVTSQQSYAIQGSYMSSGGNSESIDLGQRPQHEMPYQAQPQEPTAVYYGQAREVSAIVGCQGQQVFQEQSSQYIGYSNQSIMIGEENNFIYAQSDKYSNSLDTSDRDRVSLQDQQPHQYYQPAHSDTVYYLSPKVGGPEAGFPLDF